MPGTWHRPWELSATAVISAADHAPLGAKRIGRELACGHHTIKRYLEADGYVGCRRPARGKTPDELEGRHAIADLRDASPLVAHPRRGTETVENSEH